MNLRYTGYFSNIFFKSIKRVKIKSHETDKFGDSFDKYYKNNGMRHINL